MFVIAQDCDIRINRTSCALILILVLIFLPLINNMNAIDTENEEDWVSHSLVLSNCLLMWK